MSTPLTEESTEFKRNHTQYSTKMYIILQFIEHTYTHTGMPSRKEIRINRIPQECMQIRSSGIDRTQLNDVVISTSFAFRTNNNPFPRPSLITTTDRVTYATNRSVMYLCKRTYVQMYVFTYVRCT